MAWSIFQQGGGQGAAVTWAEKLQTALGITPNPVDTQFIYDWEVSEGGGGAYNPLNQGPVPGHPELTTTGSQYGGGAADFASWDAGVQGAVDYIQGMGSYSGVLKGLQDQNYQEAQQALFNSGWASSHYGYGSLWSTAAVPGTGTPLPINLTGSPGSSKGTGSPNSSGNGAPSASSSPFSIWNLAGIPDPIDALERLGLILLGAALILLGIYLLAGKQTLQFTPLGKFTQEGQRRTAREARDTRAREAGERQERAHGLRERRVTLAERVEARHRGET